VHPRDKEINAQHQQRGTCAAPEKLKILEEDM